MRFWIPFLLASIAVTALVFNATRLVRLSRRRAAAIETTKSRIRGAQAALRGFADREVAYRRFAEAEQAQAEEFSSAADQFQKLADKYGRFAIPGGERFKAIAIPTYWRSFDVRAQSHRVFVPESLQAELRIEYTNAADEVIDAPEIWVAKATTIRLPPGESLVAFRCVRSQQSCTLHLNDKEVFTTQYRDRDPAAALVGLPEGEVESDLGQPLELLRLTPGSATPARQESLRISFARRDGAER